MILEQSFLLSGTLAYLEIKEMANLLAVRTTFKKLLLFTKLSNVHVSSYDQIFFVEKYLQLPNCIHLCFSNFDSVQDWQQTIGTVLSSDFRLAHIIINRAWISEHVDARRGRGNLSAFMFIDRKFAGKNVSFSDCAIDDGFPRLPGTLVKTSTYPWFQRAVTQDTDLVFMDASPISLFNYLGMYLGMQTCHSPQFNPYPPPRKRQRTF